MDARNRSLDDWFVRIRTGQIRLPRFQRFEAWGSREVADLLQTVIDELPAGALLVLEIGDSSPFVHRTLAGAPDPTERITELLFDGQQRLTALWRSLIGDYPDRSFFVDIRDIAELPCLFAELQGGLYKTVCLVALKTGMRAGEIAALRWGDVDLDEAVVRVRRSYTGGELGTPKNRERRDVDLISDVVELLGWWRAERATPAHAGTLVFPGEGGSLFLSSSILLRRQLYPAMRRAGVPRAGPTQERRTFHSFRHTFAKRALESGAQITWLSRHLGHSSLKVTTDIYGHWERAERKLQAAKMEGVFPV